VSGVPKRDPERPQDDPWDSDAVRYLLGFGDVRASWTRGTLMEHLRGQPRLAPGRVEAAAKIALRHGVSRRSDPDGTTLHFFRSDAEAPGYPKSSAERRRLLRDGLP
jgi:hypothetical protein